MDTLTRESLDLSEIEPISGSGAEAEQHQDGSLLVSLSPVSGALGAISPPLNVWWGQGEEPIILHVELQAQADAVGVALLSHDLSAQLSGETRCLVAEGTKTASFYVDKDVLRGRLMIRNYGTNDRSPRVRIYSARVEAAKALTELEVKRVRASEHSFWYYSMDLGDGVAPQAGFPDAPLDMRGHYRGRRILHWLLDRYLGGVQGKHVIEAACSGGFHVIETARRGARVTAFDLDRVGLHQASLAVECLQDQFAIRPELLYANIYDFRASPPADIYYCSGLLYHLPDITGAAKMIAENCTQGAVIQSSISTLPGDLLEFAGTASYPFCTPGGEFAFIPTRSVLPHIFAWAGFREQHWFDISEFHGNWDDEHIAYRPGISTDSSGPVYGALLK